MLKMSLFRTFEPFGFFWKKVTILKVTILALEISFVKKYPAGAEMEPGGGFILYSMHSERRCVFRHKLGVLILQIPSSCWGFVFC